MNCASTSQLVTADIAVGKSGAPTRVFQITSLCDGTPRSVILRNGTSTSGTIYWQKTGTASVSVTNDFGEEGLLFPGGCFADVVAAAGVSSVITYRTEES
jgi:hypothetical protein